MSRIIDAHTHAFPPDICRSRELRTRQDDWFRQLYQDPSALLTGETELLESMEVSGIEHSIIAGFPWADEGLCREHNDWMADVCRRHPDRLSFLATVVPDTPSAPGLAARAFENGAIGVGELNADAQGFDLLDPASMTGLVEVCTAASKPIMFHASEPLGHIYAGKGIGYA